MDVRTEDNCRLWTDATGQGKPLVMCHGGPTRLGPELTFRLD